MTGTTGHTTTFGLWITRIMYTVHVPSCAIEPDFGWFNPRGDPIAVIGAHHVVGDTDRDADKGVWVMGAFSVQSIGICQNPQHLHAAYGEGQWNPFQPEGYYPVPGHGTEYPCSSYYQRTWAPYGQFESLKVKVILSGDGSQAQCLGTIKYYPTPWGNPLPYTYKLPVCDRLAGSIPVDFDLNDVTWSTQDFGLALAGETKVLDVSPAP